MEMPNSGLFIEYLYREVGDMLLRAKSMQPNGSEELKQLDLAYGGVETIKHRFPTSESWWMEAAEGLESIRSKLVTMSEDRLYTM
ncbi:hypothetical protein D7Z26_03995 [Cohnella endophytica]|uniref:Uncharacterized protein n=1 Tax=Cohnella endophytica TaxID=2419778 RepID=A0A494Y904_9BACL|nr:hypothetical protein [Cohnella endophytica]RKP57153.1 hypothetical protein D7Z26_03995 [Cohnella endophytica]